MPRRDTRLSVSRKGCSRYDTTASKSERESFDTLTCRSDTRPKTGTEYRGEISVGDQRPMVYVSTDELDPHRRYAARFEVVSLDGIRLVVVVRDPVPLTDR